MKKITSVFLKFFIFFVLIGFKCVDVKAFQHEKGIYTRSSLCLDDSCVPLCIYYEDLSDEVLEKIKEENEAGKADPLQLLETKMIGYYYTKSGDGVIANKMPEKGWFISFPSAHIYKHRAFGVLWNVNDDVPTPDISYSISSEVPYSDIFASATENFKDSELYNELSNNYVCPKIMSVIDDYSKVSLSNEKIEVSSNLSPGVYNAWKGSTKSYSYKLQYSFRDEAKLIIERSLSDVSWRYSLEQHLPQEAINIKRLQFVTELENNVSTDGYSQRHGGEQMDIKIEAIGKPSKETLDKYCPYFKEVIEADKGESYSIKLKDYYQQPYFTKFKESLQKYASTSAKNPSIYEYETLSKILEYRDYSDNGSNSDSQNGVRKYRIEEFGKFEDLLNEDIADSLNYISELCSDNGHAIEFDKNASKTALNDHPLYTYEDPVIEFKDNYDCSILSDFADIISTGYFIIEMLGLAILILLSSMDYLKIFLNDNSDELKKANSNFAKRLGIVVALFLLPAFINVLFNIFHIEGVNSEHPLCVQISNK